MSRLHPRGLKKTSSITIEEGSLKRKIAVEDILFVKAEHVYVSIYLSNDKRLLHRITLSGFFQKLPPTKFVRVHRSFIVNQEKIDQLKNDRLSIQGHVIPISRSRRKWLNPALAAS